MKIIAPPHGFSNVILSHLVPILPARIRTQLRLRDLWLKEVEESRKSRSIIKVSGVIFVDLGVWVGIKFVHVCVQMIPQHVLDRLQVLTSYK